MELFKVSSHTSYCDDNKKSISVFNINNEV